VINFRDWPLDRDTAPDDYDGPVAADYPLCLEIVESKVRPEREKLIGRNAIGTKRGTYWWRFAADAKSLYRAIENMQWVLPISSVAKHPAFAAVPTGIVFDHNLTVLAVGEWDGFAILSSRLHLGWAAEYSSTLENRIGYRPKDCLETFPFPATHPPTLAAIGEAYYEHRRQVMLGRWEGLTKTYNRFHDPQEAAEDIGRLRELHVEMDHAVAAAYGWTDLDLGHGFHETKQGLRYTISDPARREVLSRLLQLNHDRYAEEVRQGLHERKKAKGKGPGRKPKATKGDDHPTLGVLDDE
jgi:hypothetical protein